MTKSRTLLAALSLLLLSGTAAPASEVNSGILGQDDRVMVDSWESPWQAIGRINVSGRAFCSGVLIAPDEVLTAAHCLVWPGSGQLRELDDIHFVAARRREDYLGHSTARSVTLHPGFEIAEAERLDRRFADIALVKLREPMEVTPLEPEEAFRPSEENRFDYAFYSKDRRYLPSLHAGCGLLSVREGYWFVDCDTVEGGSGGPLLVKSEGTWRPVALVVGYFRKDGFSASIAVPLKELSLLRGAE